MRRLYGQGKTLKAEIKRKGRTREYVADTVGIPLSSLDAYLNDRQPIPEVKLRGILAAFPEFDKKLFSFGEEAGQRKLQVSNG